MISHRVSLSHTYFTHTLTFIFLNSKALVLCALTSTPPQPRTGNDQTLAYSTLSIEAREREDLYIHQQYGLGRATTSSVSSVPT